MNNNIADTESSLEELTSPSEDTRNVGAAKDPWGSDDSELLLLCEMLSGILGNGFNCGEAYRQSLKSENHQSHDN